ncbi:hypothetical protein PG5_03220 [Pseudomonas sp. G5(2012)]|nr:hypothetical protein PG5_03220 [Pseudomonas sp. G5(2012)]
MVVNDDAISLAPRGVLRFFASMLAPTRGWLLVRNQKKPSGLMS